MNMKYIIFSALMINTVFTSSVFAQGKIVSPVVAFCLGGGLMSSVAGCAIAARKGAIAGSKYGIKLGRIGGITGAVAGTVIGGTSGAIVGGISGISFMLFMPVGLIVKK
ncbi:MAG TPA: hypothetical protein VLB80_02355 [Candidatus Babeliales bacterium]|nr:hypothetical protein [Candidatus Babeliales bacterium]